MDTPIKAQETMEAEETKEVIKIAIIDDAFDDTYPDIDQESIK